MVQFAAIGRPTLEVGGYDYGTSTNGLGNFGMSQLIVGSPTQKAVLELVDQVNNGQRGSTGKEALYLLNVSGTGLRIEDGSTLVLNGLDAYTIVNNQFINLNSLFSPGQNIVAYDGGWLAKTMTNIPGGWKVDSDGNWGADSNWNMGSPNAVGESAYFGPVISAPRTITLDAPKTVGYIGFEGNQEYTVAGTNTLTMQGETGANIEVVSGIHQITAPVYLALDTQVNVTNANDSLRLANVSAVNFTTITKEGLGTLSIAPVGLANLSIAQGNVNMIASAAAGANSFNNVDVASGAIWSLVSYDQTIATLSDSGAVDLGFGRLTVGPGDAGSSFSGTITGSAGVQNAGLTVAGVVDANVPGSGILTLSGSTTYQGDTNIVSGGLQFGASNIAATASAFKISSGASLILNNFSQTIGSLAGGGNVQLGTATLTFGGNNLNTELDGVISGTGGITKNGTGIFILTNVNTFTGATTIGGGVIQLNNPLALENSTVQINVNNGLNENGLAATVGAISGGGNLVISGLSLTSGGNNANTTFSGAISGSGELIKTGGGTLALRGSNIYAGGTEIDGGLLDIDSDARLGAAGTTLTMNNGTIYWDTGNAWTTSRPIIVSGGTGTLQTNGATVTLNGAISGTGTFVKTGNGTVVLNSANTVAGMDISAGRLEFAASGSAGSGTLAATNITSGAAIVLSKTSGSASGALSNPVRLDLGATSISFRVDNTYSLELDGPMSGVADFSLGTGGASGSGVGVGTLILGGNNSAYSGTITVQTGTLVAASNTALGSSGNGTRISPGAILAFDGPLNYGLAEPIALAGTLSAYGGTTNFAGTVSLSGPASIDVAAGSTLSLGGMVGTYALTKTSGGTVVVPNLSGNSVTISAGTLKLAPFHGGPVSVGSLSIAAGAVLDLNGELIYPYSGTSPLPALLNGIKAGYAAGQWDGTSTTSPVIISSDAASHAGGIGYADNGLQVELDYTWLGDANLDGLVNSADLSLMSSTGKNWQTGDFNYDGKVNADDFGLYILGAAASQGVNISATLPEPAGAMVIAGGILVGWRRGRRIYRRRRW